jgi:hypothetical protein
MAWNLWSWVDARGVAQACRLRLEVDVIKAGGTGADVFPITAVDTLIHQSNRELMAQAFPGVPLATAASGHETLLSVEKAHRPLGCKPDLTWRTPQSSDVLANIITSNDKSNNAGLRLIESSAYGIPDFNVAPTLSGGVLTLTRCRLDPAAARNVQ